MTYKKLIDYLTKITDNKPPEPVKKGTGEIETNWPCKHCLPCNEYYHCLYYIKRKINEKYLGITMRSKLNTTSYPFQWGDLFVDIFGNVSRKEKESGEEIKIGRISKYGCESYTDKVCNACKFVPEYPTHCKKPPSNNCCENESCYWYFMNQCRTAKEINEVIPGVNPSLAYWICSAFDFDVDGELEKIGLVGKQFKKITWKIDGKDIKKEFFDDKFWKMRLCKY